MNKQKLIAIALLPLMAFLHFGCSLANDGYPPVEVVSKIDEPDLLKQAQKGIVTLAYGPHLERGANLLDFRLPSNGKSPYPLIVYVHGGGWSSGDKYPFPSVLLHSDGYATASINYRLTGQAKFPAQIIDCKQAIAWLRSNAATLHIDPERIGVWGASAGGHLVALLGTTGDARSPAWAQAAAGTSNKVQAVCDWCGPANLLTIESQSPPDRNLMASITSLLGSPVTQAPELAQEASPVTYAHDGCPPFLIMHGDRDWLVPTAQSKELLAALKEKTADCTLEVVKGGHNFYTAENEYRVRKFFDGALKTKLR